MTLRRGKRAEDLTHLLERPGLNRNKWDPNGNGCLCFAKKLLDVMLETVWIDSNDQALRVKALLESFGVDHPVGNRYIIPNGTLIPF